MAGIVRYGSYVPYFRVQRAAFGAGKGERAVASYDEDSVSMAVEAARDAVRGATGIDAGAVRYDQSGVCREARRGDHRRSPRRARRH